MPQLTAADYVILNQYANNGQRELYWDYLASKGDIYAVRAGEVSRNDTFSGQVANYHAVAHVPDNQQSTFTEVKWDQFGQQLVKADLLARERLFDKHAADGGLSLSVDVIREYHEQTFKTYELPKEAWTLERVIGPLIDKGDIASAQKIWDMAMSDGTGYAMGALASGAQAAANGSVGWFPDTVFAALAFDPRNAFNNPNNINGFDFDAATSQWSRPSTVVMAGSSVVMIAATADQVAILNANREWRLDHLNDSGRYVRASGDTGLNYDPLQPHTSPSSGSVLTDAQKAILDWWVELQSIRQWSVETVGDVGRDALLSNSIFIAGADHLFGSADAVLNGLQSLFAQAETTRSPLILDLDGNGVSTLAKSAGIHFDHDASNFAELTGWVDAGDGLLVRDVNGNGQIDSGRELFGNNTLLSSGAKAGDGFTALADLDSNHDGKVTAADPAFAQLRVWKDGNANGKVDAGELLTLGEAGVQSLHTAHTQQQKTDAQGNQHLQVGTFMTVDGQVRALEDVWFAVDSARTADLHALPETAAIAALPDLPGMGNVHSLHQAMLRDTSGRLQALVQSFSSESDPDARLGILTTLIYTWAGVQNIDPASRAASQIYGNVIGDARKLASLEAFLGEGYVGTWCWGEVDPNPHGNAAPLLIRAFDELLGWCSTQLLAQTRHKALYDGMGLRWSADSNSLQIDVSGVIAELRTHYAQDPQDTLKLAREFGFALSTKGDFGAEILGALKSYGNLAGDGLDVQLARLGFAEGLGTEAANVLYGQGGLPNNLSGLGGDDRLYGADGGDSLEGGTGNDWLDAAGGNDSLHGGEGADVMTGGDGSDTYVYRLGDGADSIVEFANGGVDIVLLGATLNAGNVVVRREAMDAVLIFNESDALRLTGYFNGNAVESIRFPDGTAWDYAAVTRRLSYDGTTRNDYMTGLRGVANRINGLAGDDNIGGADKDDVLAGGAGNDALSGDVGNDTYVYNTGDGSDWINDYRYQGTADVLKLGAGIAADFTRIARNGNDLILTFNAGGADTVRIASYFGGGTIEAIEFADGIRWDLATVQSKLTQDGTTANDYLTALSGVANRINGLAGDDQISGADKDDVLSGGSGNDALSGWAGNDTYVYNTGDGSDTVTDSVYYGTADVLNLGAGITAELTQIARNSSDLILTFNAAGTDKVRVAGYFGGGTIETIQFADGTAWDYAAVTSRLTYDGTAGNDWLSGLSGVANRINGQGGDDRIYGADKDDTLDGGAGNDALNGGAGNDVYLFGRGGGQDYIGSDYGTASTKLNVLQFKDGVLPTDVTAVRSSSSLILGIAGTMDQITLGDFFYSDTPYNAYNPIQQVKFANGTVWDIEAIKAISLAPSDAAQTIIGFATDDRIDGGAGDDTLLGMAGDDSLLGGQGDDVLDGNYGTDLLDGGAGNDTADYRFYGSAVSINLATGAVAFAGAASTEALLSIENLLTGSGADALTGDAGSNVLQSGDGNDTLNGSAGDDRLLAGNGDDRLLGGDGDDWLDGGFGTDILDGGAGRDTADFRYYNSAVSITLATGIVTFAGSSTTETLQSIEALATGSGADALTGDANANVLQTGDGNDTLQGAGGNDSLVGGAGDDVAVFAGNFAQYQVTYNASTQTYTVADAVAARDGIDQLTGVERLQFSDAAGLPSAFMAVVGGSGNDSLVGTAGNDNLQGLAGNDTLLGGMANWEPPQEVALIGSHAGLPELIDARW